MRLILTAEQALADQRAACRNGQLRSGTDYFGCPCFLFPLHWLLMVTIEKLLPYSYWSGHPVTNRAIIYLFVGFVPLNLKVVKTLNLILLLNKAKWELKSQHRKQELTKPH